MTDAENPDEIEVAMVTMVFDATDAATLLGVLSKYVVVSRSHDGCRNIDLGASTTVEGRFMIVEKWESIESQQSHFDSPAMVEMAESCRGILSKAPTIDLIEAITVHDLA